MPAAPAPAFAELTREQWALGPLSLIDVDRYQNPLYPRDAAMSVEQMEAHARAGSMWRARAPAERVCKIDDVSSRAEPLHGHDRETFMDYRYDHVIAPRDPWTFWWLFDQWAARQLPPVPPPPRPPAIAEWRPRARVAEMNGWSAGWIGFTFATFIGASQLVPLAGTRTRIRLNAACTFGSVYVGPASTRRWVAESLHQLMFSGSTIGIPTIGPDWELVSDPLPFGIESPNGIIVSGNVIGTHAGSASLATRGLQPDWYSRSFMGNGASMLDKSRTDIGWTDVPQAVLAVLAVEGWYEAEEKPLPPAGWMTRYFGAINVMATGWQGRSFVTLIGPSRLGAPGLQTRVTLAGSCIFDNVYIGACSSTPWVAEELHPLKFGGQSEGWCANTLTTDLLPEGIEAPYGLLISGYVKNPHPSEPFFTILGQSTNQSDCWSRSVNGDRAAELNKSGWGAAVNTVLGTRDIEIRL